jgi:predicted DNA-binding transcriptional regulator AlpA
MQSKTQKPLGALTVSEFMEVVEPLIQQAIEKHLSRLILLQSNKQSSQSNQLIGRQEISRHFGVSLTTISNWDKCNKLPPKIKQGRLVYYRKKDLEEWISKNEVKIK